MKFSPDQKIIHEIAEYHSMGHDVYVNIKTMEMTNIPNSMYDSYFDTDEWLGKELKKIEDNADEYITLESPESYESFRIMESFIDSLPSSLDKAELMKAIHLRHPFRSFNSIIHQSQFRED